MKVQTSLKGKISCTLPATGKRLSCKAVPGGVLVKIPSDLATKLAAQPAVVFKLETR
jgi:hypothetical protein